MVDIFINKESIQNKQQTIIKNSKEEKDFINKLKNEVGNLDTTNISDSKSLERYYKTKVWTDFRVRVRIDKI